VQIEEIILGCKSGDEKSQRELVNRYSGLLFTVCRRYAKDFNDAKDILQDGFIEIFNSFNSYDPAKGGLENWMKQIVARTAIRRYRKMYMVKETYDKNIDYQGEYESNIIDKMELEYLMEIITSLPFKYRQIFNLYIFEEYSHKEIGIMLGINESSSRSRLSRARQMLMEKLSKLYPNLQLTGFNF
jgi:RNA polymerase sigma-70 factor (ECF subfamily)